MPAPSARLTGLHGTGSDGWEMLYAAEARRAAGARVIDLTQGDHDQTTPAPLIDAMARAAHGGATGYAPIAGLPALRQAIAARVQRQSGVETTPAHVAITPGGQAALFSALMACAAPGDGVLFADPYYATYPGTIRAAGARPTPLPLDPGAGFTLTRRVLEAAPAASALLINTPHNPTGVIHDAEACTGIARFAEARDLWVISDEVYDGLIWEGDFTTLRAVPGMAERTVILGSFSKSHIMTGWRLGWMVAPEPVIAAVSDLLTNTTYGLPGFIQAAGLAALEMEQIPAKVLDRTRARAAAVLAAIPAGHAIRAVPARGGMFVMLDIRATGLSGQSFARGLLEHHDIAVMPGESFGAAGAGHIRIALTTGKAALSQATQTLITYAETYL